MPGTSSFALLDPCAFCLRSAAVATSTPLERERLTAVKAAAGEARFVLVQLAALPALKVGEEPGYPRFKGQQRYPGSGYKTQGDELWFTPGEKWRRGTLEAIRYWRNVARGEARIAGRVVYADI